MINEAVYTLYEGVGSVDAIDTRCGSAPTIMGRCSSPISSGWTPACRSWVLTKELANSKYRPCPLLVKYVEAGWLGRKTSAASTTIAAKSRCRPDRASIGTPKPWPDRKALRGDYCGKTTISPFIAGWCVALRSR
jgi:3-hydroxyacyl-CoA dehydrogenase